jgi:hypothetical protein
MQRTHLHRRVSAAVLDFPFLAVLVGLFLSSVSLVGEADAATKTWTGATGSQWSNAANWSPPGAPVNGDALVFPGAASTLITTNDLSNLAVADVQFTTSGYTIGGNALTITGAYNSTGGNTISAPLTFVGAGKTLSGDTFAAVNVTNASPVSFVGTEHTGAFNAGSSDANFSNALLRGSLTGSGRINLNSFGVLNYTGSGTFSGTIGGMLNLGGGQLTSADLVGGEVNGHGSIATVRNPTFIRPRQLNANNRGRVPTSSGILTIGTAEGGNYSIQLNGPIAGTNYSQVVINSRVSLDGDLYLGMDANFFPQQGDRFTIVDNRGSQPVVGTFNQLAEGALFPFNNGYVLQISYQGGDGNDVTLTVTQAPNIWRGPSGGVWSNPNNWSQGTPKNGDAIGFDSRLTSSASSGLYVVHNDLAGLEISSINFGAQGLDIRGNRLSITQQITSYGINVISAPVFFRGAVFASNWGAPQSLIFSGGIELGAHGAVIDNARIVNLDTKAFDARIGGKIEGTLGGSGTIQAATFAWYDSLRFSLEVAASGTFNGTLNGSTANAPTGAFVGGIRLAGANLPNAKLIAVYAQIGGSSSALDTITIDTLELLGELPLRRARISSRATYFLGAVGPVPSMRATEEINVAGAQLFVTSPADFVAPNSGFTLATLPNSAPVVGTFTNQPEGSTISVGAKSFVLSYRGGDGNDLTLAQPLNASTTSISVETTPNPVNPDEVFTITARVNTAGAAIPTGQVSFYLDPPGGSARVANLSSGSASVTSIYGFAGSRAVRVTYSGDAANAGSETSATINVQYTIRIADQALPDGTVGATYAAPPFSVTGAGGNYTTSIVAGALPLGLSLNGLQITGSPRGMQRSTFTLRAQNATGASATRTFTINVTPARSGSLFFPGVGTRLPPGVNGTPYTPLYFGAWGGTPPYSFSTADPLPPGMSLTPDGVLRGTPSEVNTYAFRLQVRDAAGALSSTVQFFETLAAPISAPPTAVVAPGPQLVGEPLILQTSSTPNISPLLVSLTPNVCSLWGAVVSHLLPGTCSIAVNFRFGVDAPDGSLYPYTFQRIVTYSVTSVASAGIPVPTNLICTAQVLGAICQFSVPGASTASADSFGLRCTSSLTTRESSGPSSPIVISGLSATEHYSCTVWAVAGGTRGTPSNPSNSFTPLANVSPPNPNAPPAPQINRAIGGDGEAIVAFTGLPGDARYPTLYYTVSSMPITRDVNCSAPCSNVRVPGLTNDVPYTFTVKANNSQGMSDASAQSNPVTPTQNTPLRVISSPLAQQPGGIDIDGNNRSQLLARIDATGVIQIGRPNGSFFNFESVTQLASPTRVLAAGDFNNSGVSSLLFQDLANGDPGMVFAQPLNGGAATSVRALKRAWIPEVVADLDGDGTTDVAFRYTGTDGRPDDVGVSYIWFMKRNGVEQVRKRGGAPLTWKLIGAADFNGDYAADMVYISPTNQVRVLMATANRTCANYLAGALPTGFAPVKVADFEGNGRGSILLRNPSSGATLLFGIDARGVTLPAPTANPDDPNASCTSTTQSLTSYVVNAPSSVGLEFFAAGDFDGDGIWDILWRNPATGALTMWLMRADSSRPDVFTIFGTPPPGSTLLQP